MSNVFMLEAAMSNGVGVDRSVRRSGRIFDFKRCPRRYFQVGGGKNPNSELTGTLHNSNTFCVMT